MSFLIEITKGFFNKNIKNKQSFVGGQGHVYVCVVLKQEYFIIFASPNLTYLIIILKSLNPTTSRLLIQLTQHDLCNMFNNHLNYYGMFGKL